MSCHPFCPASEPPGTDGQNLLSHYSEWAVFNRGRKPLARSVGMQSEVLPQDLVVEVDGRLGEKRDAIKKVLLELDKNDEGKKLGILLQTATFPAWNENRLEAAGVKGK